MFQKAILAIFLLLSHVTPSIGDPKICAEAVMALMQKDDYALAYQIIEVIRAYNSTCENMSLCTFHMDEDTALYMDSATSDEASKLNFPDFPISGSITADFEGFSSHDSVANYEASCVKEGGYIHHIDTDLVLKGTAMDLVDLDVEMKVKNFPMCLATNGSSCEGEDLEQVVEEAVKLMTIANAEGLSEQQIAVINGMTIDLACAATGIKKCKLTIVDSFRNTSNDNEETSGVTSFNGELPFLFVATVGSFFIIN